jgi:hypothetical protein
MKVELENLREKLKTELKAVKDDLLRFELACLSERFF